MTPRAASKNKRVELGDRSKESILDAASKLMSERGYDGTSISAIAQESGLPASSIYWHFASKLGILTAVIDRGYARFLEAVPLDSTLRDGTRLENLIALLEGAENAIEATPEFVRLQLIIMLNSPAADVREAVERIRAQQKNGLRDGLAGAFADLGADRASIVADEFVDFASAAFEGIFLARQSDVTVMHTVIAQLAQSIVALAEEFMADDPRFVSAPSLPPS